MEHQTPSKMGKRNVTCWTSRWRQLGPSVVVIAVGKKPFPLPSTTSSSNPYARPQSTPHTDQATNKHHTGRGDKAQQGFQLGIKDQDGSYSYYKS